MLETRFTRLVGCRVPIQVAPMGGITGPALITAASRAGAMTMVGTAGVSPEQVDVMLAAAEGPVGVNALMPLLDRDLVAKVAPRARVMDFYHGDPDASLVQLVHGAGALACWQVGSVEEARAAVEAGCDLLAVRGTEGGGRMHGTQPLWPLLNGVLDAVDVPVLAAGGLATARDLAAVLAAGADGARMGTRFVATEESGAHPRYKEAIVAAAADETALVDDFSVLWPEGPRPHRVLTAALDAAAAVDSDTVGEADFLGERRAVPRFAVLAPLADTTGNVEAMAMYAGVSAGAIHAVEPAAQVVADLVDGAERLLRRYCG